MSENKTKVRNIGCLDYPRESGSVKAAVESLKKNVANDAPAIFGTYYCERSEAEVYIPIRELTAWAIVEDEGKRRVVLAHNILMFDILFSEHIIERGECEFGRGGAWKMPSSVTEQFASGSLVCVGMNNYAELLTEEDFNSFNERDQHGIEDILNKIGL